MHLQKRLGIRRCHHHRQRMVVQSNQNRRLASHRRPYRSAWPGRLDKDQVQRNRRRVQR